MPLNPAISYNQNNKSRPLIVFIIYSGIKLFDLAGPLQVFVDAISSTDGSALHETAVCSINGGAISTDAGVKVTTIPFSSLTHKNIDIVLVVGGMSSRETARDKQFISEFLRLSKRSNRVGSICTGAFILAEAGLLDGKRAVTHWESCKALALTFPKVKVEHNPIFVRDENVWSSAGVSAGIDLALGMVEVDYGHTVAMDIARSLVIFLKRTGGQSQFSNVLSAQMKDGAGIFEDLHNWIAAHLHEKLSVDILAERCAMSNRNFSRVYKSVIGLSPARSVEMIRLDTAKRLLESGEISLKLVSVKCGLGNEQRLRQLFIRHFGISPSDYRAQFSPWS